MYEFINRPCNKLAGPDIQIQLTQRRESINDMTSRLTPGDWIIFRSTRDEDQPFWLGRTLSKQEWDNQCIWYNDRGRNKTFEGAIIKNGKYGINVQWHTQKVIGILEYIVEGGDNAHPIVQSNRDLILTGFDKHIHQVIGTRTRAPRQQTVRSNRMQDFQYSSGRESLQTTEGDWYRT